ncbi:MAG: ABC transporter permease [Lentimicrobiaceae bacterium]|nr:ABC transporter permease [Lentimicrobiaceae bacterium]
MSLIQNYLKTAVRNLVRLRIHSIINISGLAIGLSCFFIIMLYVDDETKFDQHHSKSERIYRMVSTSDFEGVAERSSSCPAPLGPTIAQEYPYIIDKMTRVFNDWSSEFYIEYKDKGYREKRLFFVDSTFADIFDIELINGNRNEALSTPYTALITASTAKRYFGNANPVGKVIKLEGKTNITITGVIADTPSQSHFTYDFLVSMSTLRMLWGGHMPSTWVYNPFWTYILLKPGADIRTLEEKLPAFTSKYFYDAEKDHITLTVQPLTKIHLSSALDYEIEPNGKLSYVRILTAVAFFILMIAIINYINLSTAFADRRSRETAIRKVSGATYRQLFLQYLGESLLLTLIALTLSLAIIELLLPAFNSFAGKNILSSSVYKGDFLLKILFTWLITSLLSGIYPAFFLSRYKPVGILKGRNGNHSINPTGRKIMVVLQFSLSIMLITASMMAFDQLNFLRNASLGFEKENIIFIPVNRSPVVKQYEAFKSELMNQPGIKGVTAVDYIIGTDHNNHEFRPEGYPADKWQFYPALVVRDDFVNVFNIKIVAGRDYFKKSKTDPMESILINEAMVNHMGWKSNQDAIGKKFNSRIGNEKVVGVFKNFHASSLHSKAGPLVINIKEDPREIDAFTNFVAVKLTAGNQQEIISKINEIWKSYAPGRPFEYTFLNTELNKLYREEEYLGKSAAILSILTILIAAMGLFGLVYYMAAQRTREIGIRKVLGANTYSLVKLLISGYIRLIAISNLIAWPATYLVINYWFSSFAYHTSLNWWYFIYSGLISFILSAGIAGIRAYHVSGINPAVTLKYE